MPRQARVKGEFSIYHIIQRGNEKKDLFLSNDDRFRFVDTLLRMKKKYNFLLYAHCLMNNHVHLLIEENGNDISSLVKSINVSYVSYFNRTHKRCGHLFQDRFKSEPVDNDAYLLEVSRYIHNNPVKAQLVKEPGEYRWSSYNIYAGKEKDKRGLIDTGRVLDYFAGSRTNATSAYINFVNKAENRHLNIMDVEEPFGEDEYNCDYVNTMQEARLKIEKAVKEKGISYTELNNHIEFRNDLIREIRRNSPLTLKEIGELVGGVSESRVSRILGSG